MLTYLIETAGPTTNWFPEAVGTDEKKCRAYIEQWADAKGEKVDIKGSWRWTDTYEVGIFDCVGELRERIRMLVIKTV